MERLAVVFGSPRIFDHKNRGEDTKFAGIKIHPCLIAMPSSICNGGHRLGGKIRVTVRRKVAQEWALGFTKSTSKRGFLRPRRAMTQADESYGVRVTPRGLLR